MFREDLVFVLDFDGCLTDGKMYYTKRGKEMKCVGCDDWEMLYEISTLIRVNVISADKRGFGITEKRIVKEMNLQLDLVKGNSHQRWMWVKEKYPFEEIIYMGDSLNDVICLKNSNCGITVIDALDCVKDKADVVINRRGGDRAVAEAILYINNRYRLFEVLDE